MFLATHGVIRNNSGGGYTARTTAFATATGITDVTILGALNTFDLGLISNSLDTKMKALYPFVGGTATTHKFNFMDARDLDAAFRLQFNGGWVHSSTGAAPNGINGYADTYLNPSTAFADFKNNSHLLIYSRTQIPIGGGWSIGVGNTANGNPLFGLCINRASGPVNGIIYDNGDFSGNGRLETTNSDGRGLWVGSTMTSNAHKLYRNGSVIAASSLIASGAISNLSFNIGRLNATAGGYYYMSNELALTSIGTSLSDTDSSTLYTLTQAFEITLSRQV